MITLPCNSFFSLSTQKQYAGESEFCASKIIHTIVNKTSKILRTFTPYLIQQSSQMTPLVKHSTASLLEFDKNCSSLNSCTWQAYVEHTQRVDDFPSIFEGAENTKISVLKLLQCDAQKDRAKKTSSQITSWKHSTVSIKIPNGAKV